MWLERKPDTFTYGEGTSYINGIGQQPVFQSPLVSQSQPVFQSQQVIPLQNIQNSS